MTSELSVRAHAFATLSVGRHLLWRVRRADTKVYEKKDGNLDGQVESTAKCFLIPRGTSEVSIEYDYGKHKARYGGLQTCTSVWVCPVHSWQIGKGRRDELVKASAIMEEDYYALHVVFTLSHNRHHYLRDSLGALTRVNQKYRRGWSWDNFRKETGYSYDVQGLEVTWGWLNGWHPHKHVQAYFLKSVVDELSYHHPETGELLLGVPALVVMVDEFATNRWLYMLEKDGQGFSASSERGVVVKHSPQDISEYIAKFGYVPGKWRAEDEMTRSNSKLGRSDNDNQRYTPFQLLEEYMLNGSEWAAERWLEFVFTIKGRHQLDYMNGFKPFLKRNGLTVLTDKELVEQEENSPLYECLGRLNMHQWRQLNEKGLQPMFLDYVEFVEGDMGKVAQFLIEKGIDVSVAV